MASPENKHCANCIGTLLFPRSNSSDFHFPLRPIGLRQHTNTAGFPATRGH